MTLEELFNQSLQLIGDDAVIVTVNDNDKAARLCRTSYDTARRSVLQRHPWKFGRLPSNGKNGKPFCSRYVTTGRPRLDDLPAAHSDIPKMTCRCWI